MRTAGACDSLLTLACFDMSVKCTECTTTESTHTFANSQDVSAPVVTMGFHADGTNVII